VHRLEEGAGLFAVVLGVWRLGAVTPVHPYLSTASRYPKTWAKARDPRRTTRDLATKRHQTGSITFKRPAGP